MIEVTPKAVAKIKETLAKHELQGLRLGLQGGGCSGYSYLLRFDSKQRASDKVIEFEGAKVFVDPKSYALLDGLTLDYEETLLQSGFVFHNPNAKHACGCGTSFSM